MPRDQYNIIPVFLAGILHVAIVVAMVFALDSSRSVYPAIPLSIKGTLVAEQEIRRPPPESETAEQRRIDAEERKLQEDLRKERQRITRLKERQQEAVEKKRSEEIELQRRRDKAEKKRREEIELQRRRDKAEKKRSEEIELQRRRDKAEKKRLEDVERQRLENELKRREAEESERRMQFKRELAEEEQHLEAMNSGLLARYLYAIQQQIQRHWISPLSAESGLECVINVRQLPGGEVVEATIGQCNGDNAVKRSIESAVFKASPLPEPENPTLFDRNLRITFKPEQ